MVLAESSSVPAGAPNPYEGVSPYQRFDRRFRFTQYADTARLYPQSTMQESDPASVKIEMFDCLSFSRTWFHLSSREWWTPRILHRCFGKHTWLPCIVVEENVADYVLDGLPSLADLQAHGRTFAHRGIVCLVTWSAWVAMYAERASE
jgi:hypothetical protein